MLVNGEKFLSNIKSYKFEKKLFLISGNEESFVDKIKKSLILRLKEEGFVEIETTNNALINSEESFYINSQNLFYEKKIIVHQNPKDIKINMDSLRDDENAVIILYNKTIAGTKIKKFFDNSSELLSLVCYKISEAFRKQVVDIFFNKHNIQMEPDAYWYFIENSSGKYQLLENELLKIQNFKTENKKINLENIKMLISIESELEIEDLFFNSLASNKKIIIKTNEVIKLSSDSYVLLQKIKFYIDILIKTKLQILENNDLSIKEKNFPRYLFKYKKSYNLMIDKININQSMKCYGLIKKTEILLRKNDSMFLSITQRFLLNLKKTIM